MRIVNHEFTDKILAILERYFSGSANYLLQHCEIIQYLNIKTKAANRGSKSRAGFANQYALYVLVEDYINGEFNTNGGYADYEGAKFNALFRR